MSVNLNECIDIDIDMSTYLNEEDCDKLLEKSIASAVKKLNEYVNIDNHKKINGKRKCFEKMKQQKLIKELHAINNIIKSITIYLDLLD
jgi:hypothetical protein